MTRTLENRICVAQSVTAGAARLNPALDTNNGSVGVYVASDCGQLSDGIAASAEAFETWPITYADFATLNTKLQSAQVTVAQDLDAQLWPDVVRVRSELLLGLSQRR